MVGMSVPIWFSSLTHYLDIGLTMEEVWFSRHMMTGVQIRTVFFLKNLNDALVNLHSIFTCMLILADKFHV